MNASKRATDTVLSQYSAEELIALYRQRRVSPVEVVEAVLEHIKVHDPVLNAFAYLDADAALAAARRSEQRWHDGAQWSELDGIPVTVKDLLLAKGWPTLHGSRVVDPGQDWNEDSPAVARLREHGAVLLGKTTTAEFGWKGFGDSPLTGITRNPWNPAHTPGGSSGGAAAAAAIGFGPLHVASDGGGSVRQPAAFSGVFGFKPSFGRVACYPAARNGTLFHVSPMARTVRDAALLLNAIARPDARDPLALPPEDRDWRASIERGVTGLRIAYSPDLGHAKVDPEVAELVARAVKVFGELGANVEQAAPPIEDALRDIHRVLSAVAAARLFETLPQERLSLAERGLQESAEQGRQIGATRYLAAVQAREAFTRTLNLFFEKWDLLLTPTTAAPAPPVEQGALAPRSATSPFTYPFNLTRQPAASAPIGFTANGLPVGLQIVGARYRDDLVLRAARAYERRIPFIIPGTVR
ncbi:MAG: amidase [Zoogloeaceae bacterium]|jgi:aspartyl-tRNA(Asn)/glutamyl-tRNA(Gln) amidotransferase subunit A|nr:amidase [Zoogloeaceae bacterium]